MKRSFVKLFGSVLVFTGIVFGNPQFALSQANGAPQTLVGDARAAAIKNANIAINALDNIEGRFIQTNPNNSSNSGKFWLDRPGKMRFDYDAPSATYLVANNGTIAIADKKLKTVEQYPIRSNPLYFLLKENVDIAKELKIAAVIKVDDMTAIALKDAKNEAQGELTVVFNSKNQIDQWIVKDNRHQMTKVRLVETRALSSNDAQTFVIPKSKVVRAMGKGGN